MIFTKANFSKQKLVQDIKSLPKSQKKNEKYQKRPQDLQNKAPGTPKKPETPKKPKKSQPKKEEKLSCEELFKLPFDPTKCRRRLYNEGWGCQCQKDVFENGLCRVDYNTLYGEKKKESKTASAEKEIFAHGYADEPRPDTNPITGDSHRWRDENGDFPAKKGKKTSPKKDASDKQRESSCNKRRRICKLWKTTRRRNTVMKI